jgi:outer membrane receptor for Fe3+-dicitrate
LAGDPPLRQVIARTVEMRFDAGNAWGHVHAALFRTDSSDDILFVANDASGYGYFRNFGKTRRQGLELSAKARAGRFTLSASYTLLDATYRSGETVNGSGNSSSDAPAPGFEGAIEIRPGNRIPLLPRHTAKAALGWEAAPWLSLDLDMVAVSGVYARGNENNAHQPDGTYYSAPARPIPMQCSTWAAKCVQAPASRCSHWCATCSTRLCHGRATGGHGIRRAGPGGLAALAGPVIDGERPLLNSTFFAPGAPRSIQVGARLRF